MATGESGQRARTATEGAHIGSNRRRDLSSLLSVVGIVVARYIIVVVALATAISLLAQQISSIIISSFGV